MMHVSVLLLARNEEENLRRYLPALAAWCRDIVVVDDFSTDGTGEVANGYGARVFRRHFDTFAGQRNWALDNVSFQSEWVFHLDADEEITPDLAEEISVVTTTTPFIAFHVASKLMFYGSWLRHAGMYPAYQVRLGRNPGLRFIQVGHGQREALSPKEVGFLRSPLVHHGFSRGLEDWFERHNRYSSAEAAEIARDNLATGWKVRDLISGDPVRRRRALKRLTGGLRFRPFWRFLYLLLLRRAFLDGRSGLDYCLMMASYEAMIELKTRELYLRELNVRP